MCQHSKDEASLMMYSSTTLVEGEVVEIHLMIQDSQRTLQLTTTRLISLNYLFILFVFDISSPCTQLSLLTKVWPMSPSPLSPGSTIAQMHNVLLNSCPMCNVCEIHKLCITFQNAHSSPTRESSEVGIVRKQ